MRTLTLLDLTLSAYVLLVLMPMQSQAAAVGPILSAIPFIQKDRLFFYFDFDLALWHLRITGLGDNLVEHILQLVNISIRQYKTSQSPKTCDSKVFKDETKN